MSWDEPEETVWYEEKTVWDEKETVWQQWDGSKMAEWWCWETSCLVSVYDCLDVAVAVNT